MADMDTEDVENDCCFGPIYGIKLWFDESQLYNINYAILIDMHVPHPLP